MGEATLRQAAVLVGGLGTRLGSVTQATPKPMVTVGDRPFLAWLLRELCRWGVEEVVLLAGHLGEVLRERMAEVERNLPRELRLVYAQEPVRAGTGGALHHAAGLLDERFLMCNGDSWFDANLAALMAGAAAGPCRILVREVPDASRYGTVALEGGLVRDFAERGTAAPAMINAGIYVLTRDVARGVPPVCSLEREVLPALAAEGRLAATVGQGHFIDIGIPEDLARAQVELPRVLHRPALLLDRDGTLNVDHGWVGARDRWAWIPGAREAIAAATRAGWHVFVVTNQSGIARGLYSEAQMHDLHRWMCDEVRAAGGTVDDIRFAPYHPEIGPRPPAAHADWRKPGPGMLNDLAARWELDRGRCVMLGDAETDMKAAAAAGMRGVRFAGGDLREVVLPLLGSDTALPLLSSEGEPG